MIGFQAFGQAPSPDIVRLMDSLPDPAVIQTALQSYLKEWPLDDAAINMLRRTRKALLRWIADHDEITLAENYSDRLVPYVTALITSEFALHPLDGQETLILQDLMAAWTQKGSLDTPRILMLMLLRPAYMLPMIDLDHVSAWFVREFIPYAFQDFRILPAPADRSKIEQNFCRYAQQLQDYPARPDPVHDHNTLLLEFLAQARFITLYALDQARFNIWSIRANLIEMALQANHCSLPMAIPLRTTSPDKYRVGMLAMNYTANAESYFSLSHWHDLPRNHIHLTLISTMDIPRGLEHYAVQKADAYLGLNITQPNISALIRAVEQIRRLDLDFLIIGSNISTGATILTLLAAHRLARYQVINTATPVTSGFRSIDGYLSAAFNERADGQRDYHEELLLLPGAVNYYAFHFDQARPTQNFSRESLHLPADRILVFAGGNYLKFTDHTIRIWARIMAQSPEAHLVLMPFSPGWEASNKATGLMRDQITRIFTDEGANPAAISIIDTVAVRADRHRIMALCDVYIDSFPFASACSMLDPMIAGLPVVVYARPHFRGLLSSAMLQECGLDDMISHNDDHYIRRAIHLIRDPAFRNSETARITTVRDAGLPFFDTGTYGQRLEQIILKTRDQCCNRDRALLEHGLENLDQYLADITQRLQQDHNILFAGLDDQRLNEIMIAGYFRHNRTPPGQMIDVGGCYGQMSVPFLRMGWQVNLFEPDPACSAALQQLYGEYHGQLNIHDAVITDQHGNKTAFHKSATGLSGLGKNPFGAPDTIIECPTMRLDGFIRDYGISSVDFLKIDAEGFDFVVLESMGWEKIDPVHYPSIIMVEFGSNFAHQSLDTIQHGINRMHNYGYTPLIFSYEDDGNFARGIWKHRLIAITRDQPVPNNRGIASGNVIFFRQNNPGYMAYVLRQLAGMLRFEDRPAWA